MVMHFTYNIGCAADVIVVVIVVGVGVSIAVSVMNQKQIPNSVGGRGVVNGLLPFPVCLPEVPLGRYLHTYS